MAGFALLVTQALLYFAVMAVLFRFRHITGLGLFFCALGVMHFLETYLAAVFFIELPFGLISPGSTVLFSGKLAIILMLYIREDAETVRQPIYGLLIGNFLMVGLVLLLRLYGPSAALPGYNPDLTLMDQMGVLMVWGTSLLFIDSIAIILLYERLRGPVFGSATLRIFVSLSCLLTFDQVGFFLGLHMVAGTPISALIGGWIAKMGAAAFFSGMVGLYLHAFEKRLPDAGRKELADVFSKLTYRHRYEELLGRTGLDGLTGALNRDRLDVLGEASLGKARARNLPASLTMIAIDRFIEMNDHYGHAAGDAVLKGVAERIKASVRGSDQIYRYGGEEFVVICEGVTHRDALAQAELLRQSVATSLDGAPSLTPTVSIGVTTLPEDGDKLTDLLRQADRRLYEARRRGHDQVVGREVTGQAG